MKTQRELDLEKLVNALDKLLVAYRTGGRPSGKTLDDISRYRNLVGPTK